MSPPGNFTKGNDLEEEDWRRKGELDECWKVPSGRGWHKTGRCGSSCGCTMMMIT